MPSINRVELMGHLGGVPELRYTQTGKAVANFSLATTWGSGDNKKTEWHRCIVWSRPNLDWAEQASKMTAGDLVHVAGRLETDSYQQDGVEKKITKVVCDHIYWLRAKSSNGNYATGPRQNKPTTDSTMDILNKLAETRTAQALEVDPDEIPF